MVEAMFKRSPCILKKFEKIFASFCSEKKKPKLGIDFPNEMISSFGLHSLAQDRLCNALTDNHYHVLAQCFGGSHKDQPKIYLLPCL